VQKPSEAGALSSVDQDDAHLRAVRPEHFEFLYRSETSDDEG